MYSGRAWQCLSFPVLFLSRIPQVPSKCRGLYLKIVPRFMQKNAPAEPPLFEGVKGGRQRKPSSADSLMQVKRSAGART